MSNNLALPPLTQVYTLATQCPLPFFQTGHTSGIWVYQPGLWSDGIKTEIADTTIVMIKPEIIDTLRPNLKKDIFYSLYLLSALFKYSVIIGTISVNVCGAIQLMKR